MQKISGNSFGNDFSEIIIYRMDHCLAGLVFSNFLRSFITESLIVTKASQLSRKYFVNDLSPGLFSCGNILSVMAMIFDFCSFTHFSQNCTECRSHNRKPVANYDQIRCIFFQTIANDKPVKRIHGINYRMNFNSRRRRSEEY